MNISNHVSVDGRVWGEKKRKKNKKRSRSLQHAPIEVRTVVPQISIWTDVFASSHWQTATSIHFRAAFKQRSRQLSTS